MPIHPKRDLTTVFLTLALAAPALGAQKIYWTDTFTAKIQRANPDGTNVEDLVTTGLELPRGIALDVAGGKMYWTDSGTDTLGRCNLDGSDCEELVTGLSGPRGIALDLAAGRMYWASRLGGTIRRANLDGTGVDVVIAGLGEPMGVALDLTAGRIYWTDPIQFNVPGMVLRANLDGLGPDTVVTGLGDPIGIALDLAAGMVYWTDDGTGKIQRANLDGTNLEDLVTGLDGPLGLALDLDTGTMYWTVGGIGSFGAFDGKIQRSNLDGSDVENLITTGLRNPREIAILPDPCVDGEPCNDDNRCTIGDACVDGNCLGIPSNTACDDGNPCTDDDICTDGMCAGTPNSNPCDDANPCTDAVCSDGHCQAIPNYDLSTCFHYSLLVTEVNGTPCLSCPTADLPATEVGPGDTITIEAYLAHWAPAELGGFQWTINGSSFQSGSGSGISGFLSPAQVSCSSDTDCQGAFVQSGACTCNGSECQVNQLCDARSIAFLDSSRPDFAIPGSNGLVCDLCAPDFKWAAGRIFGGVVDSGEPVYVGTLILTASADARGTFRLLISDEIARTFVTDQTVTALPRLQLRPLVVNFCDVVDSPNDCNDNDLPDECEPDRDGDGLIDECDPCPDDPSDTTGDDTDGDGVLDCNDQCPGVDDLVFAPTCVGAIPTASEWGLVALTLLLLTGGKIYFARRRLAS